MANLMRDSEGKFIPQYQNQDGTGFEAQKGRYGASYVEEIGSRVLKGDVVTVVAAGTRVQLPDYPCREVTIIAKRKNNDMIYVGGSNVSKTVFGVDLFAHEQYTFRVSNTNLIWIDAEVSGSGISYVAI